MFREFLWTWIPWMFNKTNLLFSKSHSLCRVIYNEVMIKKEWIFIKNNPIPVFSEHFGSIDDDAIIWRCSLKPVTFIQTGFLNTPEKRLSYLGFTIKVQGADIDLSDWINEVRWSGSQEPTVKELFLLWSCDSGKSYFHCLDEIQVELVTDMGDTLRVSL